MRSDVTGYIVATFYFMLAIASLFIFTELTRIFWISLSTILGIIFIIAGYSQKPKTKKPIKTLPPPITPEESTTQIISEETITQQTPPEEEKVSVEESTPIETVPVETLQTETDTATEETKTLTEEQTLPPPQEQEPTTITTPNNNSNDDNDNNNNNNDEDKTTIPPPAQQIQTEEMPLTSVEGIGEKRAAKLNDLGIHTIKELSQITIEDLAKNLNIPHKTATKLIEAAKQQLQQ